MRRTTIKFIANKNTQDLLDKAERINLSADVSPFNTKTQFYEYLLRLGLKQFIDEYDK